MPEQVSLVKAGVDISEAVAESIALIGGLKIPEGAHAVVKPNICNAKNPDGMVITDFRIIEAVINLLKEKTDRITVVESDNISDTANNRLHRTGLLDLLNTWGVDFVNLSEDEIEVHSVAGKKLRLPRTVMEAEYFVNLPKIKTEGHVGVTLSIKNLFGIPTRRKKNTLHRKLNEILPYLAQVIRSDLIVVDGLVAMEGNGPLIGTRKDLGLILAGRNSLAVDSTCARLMGYDPAEIKYLRQAHELGVGPLDADGVSVLGENPSDHVSVFERPYSLKATVKSLSSIRKVYI